MFLSIELVSHTKISDDDVLSVLLLSSYKKGQWAAHQHLPTVKYSENYLK